LEGESDDEIEDEEENKISSMIEVPGVGRVHKRTALRYLLEPGQALSADRIVRYQTREKYSSIPNVSTMNVEIDDLIVGVGSNVAVRFDKGQRRPCTQDVSEGSGAREMERESGWTT
jgi:hypothetical protein